MVISSDAAIGALRVRVRVTDHGDSLARPDLGGDGGVTNWCLG
jgi:hypothetical protein